MLSVVAKAPESNYIFCSTRDIHSGAAEPAKNYEFPGPRRRFCSLPSLHVSHQIFNQRELRFYDSLLIGVLLYDPIFQFQPTQAHGRVQTIYQPSGEQS